MNLVLAEMMRYLSSYDSAAVWLCARSVHAVASLAALSAALFPDKLGVSPRVSCRIACTIPRSLEQ